MTTSSKPTVRPKSAAVNTREYDEAVMHKRFVPISESIHTRSETDLGFNPIDITPRSLSILTGSLRYFVEATLGRDAEPQWKTITKFPHSLFLDYQPRGALDIMLCACLNFKELHGLRRLELTNMDKREFNFDLLLSIQRNLQNASFIPEVKVFFARTVPTSVQPSLRAIVQKRAVTVSTASTATHIVYPDPPGTTTAETDGTDYCRALQHEGNSALVHWWYYPDSYDSWIPREDVEGLPEPPEQHVGPWHVQIRWLQDTELFNEWMNEIDYEIPEDTRMHVIPAPRVETSPASVKDKSTKSDSDKGSKKRRRMSSSSSSKHLGDADLDGTNHSSAADRAGAENMSDESDDETVRKPRRHSDSGRDRKRKDSGGHGKSNDGGVRKKARINDGGERKPMPSVKVRLPLKAPQERSKDRGRERGRKGDGARLDSRESRIELKEGNIRVKLPKFGDQRRSVEVDAKIGSRDVSKEVENDNVSSATRTPAARTMEAKSVVADRGKDGVTKGDASALPPKPGQKPSGVDAAAEDGVQEQKRPFSRRRSKKKERRSHGRMSGVSVVDDAVPIPEGEVPRIRNISTEGGNITSTIAVSRSKIDDGAVDGNGKKPTDDVSTRAKGKPSETGRDRMDIDSAQGDGRVLAVSEKMLSGDAANDPVSTADIVEALPPVTVRIPPHSRWFRTDAIHDIERRSLPEFWNSRGESKTPLVYKKYRDFMIDVWRQAPEKYLTATAARRHLAGDVSAILRVHAFLEYWGLINYGAEPESRPFLNSALLPRHSRPTPMQLDSNIAAPANGVPRLLFFDEPRPPRRDNAPVSLQKAIKNAKEKGTRSRNQVLSRRELYATAAATKYECDACGKDCSRMRYHCVGSADMELCPSCFANGMYPATLSARDFEQLTTVLSSEAYDGSVWSEAEVLLLLEGLEKHGDNWNQVAEHVGTKTNEQCVLQFLRMPLEDSFLEDQLGNWAPGEDGTQDSDDMHDAAASGEHKFAGPLLPFYDSANPVMAQVAFLAASVDPEIAAAAAQAALNAIMSQAAQKPSAKEEKSAQAQALLKGTTGTNGQCATENGFPGKPTAQNASKLGALPGKQLDAAAVESVAAVGLAAAASKAHHKAQVEAREIERRYAVVIETKMRAVDIKLKEFERLDQHLRRERERLEKERQRVFANRVDACAMRIQSEAQSRSATLPPIASKAGHQEATIPQFHQRAPVGVQRPPPGMSAIPLQVGHGGLQQSHLPEQQVHLPVHQNQVSVPQIQVPVLKGQVTMQQNQVPLRQGQMAMPDSQATAPQQPMAVQSAPPAVGPRSVAGQPSQAQGRQSTAAAQTQNNGAQSK